MLVLSRKAGECIIIGDHIQVAVLEMSSDCVKLGISAPKEIPIYRQEILSEVRNENKRALGVSPGLTLTLPRILAGVRFVATKKLSGDLCNLPPEGKDASEK